MISILPSNVNTSYFAITIVLGGGIDDIDDKLAEVLDDDVDEIQDDILDAVEVTCTVQYRVTRHSTVQLYYTHTSSTDWALSSVRTELNYFSTRASETRRGRLPGLNCPPASCCWSAASRRRLVSVLRTASPLVRQPQRIFRSGQTLDSGPATNPYNNSLIKTSSITLPPPTRNKYCRKIFSTTSALHVFQLDLLIFSFRSTGRQTLTTWHTHFFNKWKFNDLFNWSTNFLQINICPNHFLGL